jgi:hypothetical protein
MGYVSAYTGTQIDGGIGKALNNIGDLNSLTTDVKTDIVSAVNSEFSKINTRLNYKTALEPTNMFNEINFYVDAVNGDDSNDASQAHPVKTINYALSLLPRFIPSYIQVVINVNPGTYTENILIDGFTGSGQVYIVGLNIDTVIFTGAVSIEGCSAGVTISRLTFNGSGTVGILVAFRCTSISVYNMKMNGRGISIESCNFSAINNIVFTSCDKCIEVFASIYAEVIECSGTGNTHFLIVTGASTVKSDANTTDGDTITNTCGQII